MFQAGLMGYMIKKFTSVWILTVVYLALCLALQIWLMVSLYKQNVFGFELNMCLFNNFNYKVISMVVAFSVYLGSGPDCIICYSKNK